VKPIPETQQALDALSKGGDTGVEDVLLQMGQKATQIVPECVGLSVALLLQDGITLTLVASSDDIAALDATQYLDGGPCVQAAHNNQTLDVNADDLLSEDRWTMYARASAAHGIASSLSLPLLRSGRTVGSINLYASTPDAFEGHHSDLAEELGSSAASVVANADLSFATRLEAVEAPQRILDQNDIRIAVGILCTDQGVDIGTAQERLRKAAARAGITEHQAARAVRGLLHPWEPNAPSA
jgi:GAF domain-containing protein